MREKLFFVSFLTLYSVFVSCVLVWAGASFLVITTLLCGAPALILWNRLRIVSGVIPQIILCCLIFSAMVQLYAYKAGLWYELSPFNLPTLGGAPLETYLFSVLHILYFIALYEYFFDNQYVSHLLVTRARVVTMLGIGYSVLFGYIYIQPSIFLEYPFVSLLCVVASLVAFLSIARKTVPKVTVFKKAALFATCMLPLSFVFEWIMLVNGIRIFANIPEYMASISIYGSVVPVEELILLWLLPFGVVVLYEAYLDDNG